MRFIKFGIILLLVLWMVTAPVAMNASVGSVLYRVQIVVNEPVWVWVRITGKGRAEEVSSQLQKHYVELEESLVSGNADEQKWAKLAETNAFARAQTELTQLLSDQNFMVAHSLATQMHVYVVAHGQVLDALVSNPTLSSHGADVAFLQDRLAVAETSLDTVNKAFAAKYARIDFLKGIDGKLTELRQGIDAINLELGGVADNLTNQERWSYATALEKAKLLEGIANNYLGQDRYVDSYKSANEALGLVLEMRIMLQANQKFHVELLVNNLNM